MRLAAHSQCAAVSGLFRGGLCEQLANRPARRVRAGGFLYFQGDNARSVFLLRTGLIKTSVLSPRGEELTLRVHRPREIFGELCLCEGGRRDQATALEESEVVEIPLTALVARLQRDPQAALDFATSVCERLEEAYEQYRSRSMDHVIGRLGRALLRLADGRRSAAPGEWQLTHTITQQELAQMVGARRAVVSGLLNRLRERRLISYARRGPIRIDRDALLEFLRSIEVEED
jgi:CRP/FNR family transcriptional regulator